MTILHVIFSYIYLSLQHEDITSYEVLTTVGLAAGLTPEAVAEVKEHTSQPATKQRLEAYTQELVQRNVNSFNILFWCSYSYGKFLYTLHQTIDMIL